MDPDYRAMLLAVMARIEQLIAELESILLEASDSGTVDGASLKLAELRRALLEMERKLNRARLEH